MSDEPEEVEALRRVARRAGALAEQVAEETRQMEAAGIDTHDGTRLSKRSLAEALEIEAELRAIQRLFDNRNVEISVDWWRAQMTGENSE